MPLPLIHKGVSVTVDDDGRFKADIDDAVYYSYTYEEMKKRIELLQSKGFKKAVLELFIIGIHDTTPENSDTNVMSVRLDVLVGVNRATGEFQFKTNTRLHHVVPDTTENHDLLNHYVACVAPLSKLNETLNEVLIPKPYSYGRISPEEYNNVIKRLAVRYQKALAFSTGAR